jgi:hypothetical protein
MPHETIAIPLTSAPVPEGGATFLASIVYPMDAHRRDLLRLAFCRWAILKRAQIEQDWKNSVQAIKPLYFENDEQYRVVIKDGLKRLMYDRMLCYLMVHPHLTGKPKKLLGYLAPTVENAAILINQARGGTGDDGSTVESRYWRFTKPVLHGVVALYLLVRCEARYQKEEGQSKYGHETCLTNPLLAIMFYPELLQVLLELAEELRLRLPRRCPFRIENTIQFIGV